MDPAILNYLQSQQQNQMPNNGQNQGQAPYNPFDNGIRAALSSARESLGMTDKQQGKAFRQAMLAFAANNAQQPKQRGFFNNFGSIARSLAPAVEAYDTSEEEALNRNNAMANEILAYKNIEEAKQNQAEQQAWARQHAESQLGEQRRYHDMMNSYHQQKLNGAGTSQLGTEFTPITNKAEVAAYAKDKKALGSTMKELDELEGAYNKFRQDYEGNIIDPMSPFSGIANPAKDFFGKFANNKKLRTESADRHTLKSRLNKFVVSSERALKGGGVMGPKLIEMFKTQGIYPDLDRDTPEIFESKMKMLKDEIQNSYKASNLSLQYGVRLDPSNIGAFEGYLNPQQEVNTPNEIGKGAIVMVGPDNEEYDVPANKQQLYEDNGYKVIE